VVGRYGASYSLYNIFGFAPFTTQNTSNLSFFFVLLEIFQDCIVKDFVHCLLL
jgi:hypothetical protein